MSPESSRKDAETADWLLECIEMALSASAEWAASPSSLHLPPRQEISHLVSGNGFSDPTRASERPGRRRAELHHHHVRSWTPLRGGPRGRIDHLWACRLSTRCWSPETLRSPYFPHRKYRLRFRLSEPHAGQLRRGPRQRSGDISGRHVPELLARRRRARIVLRLVSHQRPRRGHGHLRSNPLTRSTYLRW